MKIKLTVAIITYNEERNIERCLLSIIKIADEIIVIDSFSRDNTGNICSKYNVKFIQNEFKGHIEQKNFAISQAENKYILSLDADECLSEMAIQDIMSAKENWQFDGYSFNRLNNYCGKWIKHGGWYPDKKLRLWDSSKGSWQGENPHDEFVLSNHCSIKKLQSDIMHYTLSSTEEHIKQIQYFTDIASKAAYDKGKQAYLLHLGLAPSLKFFKDYIVKLGFMDGAKGFTIARLSAWASYLKYQKLRKLQSSKP